MWTLDRIRKLVNAQIKRAGSQARWATAHGVSVSYVGDFLHGKRRGGKILTSMGFRKVEDRYEKMRAP